MIGCHRPRLIGRCCLPDDLAGRVVSKAQILDHVWEYDWNGDAAIVESYISYLRRKVDQIQGADGQPVTPLIQTRRGVGYMLREPKAE